MDWTKFERMSELYGGGTKPKKSKTTTKRKRKNKPRNQSIGPTTGLKGVSKAFYDNHEAVKEFQKKLKAHPTIAEKRFKKILHEFFGFNMKSRKASKAARRFVGFQKIFMLDTLDGRGKGYIADFYLAKFKLIIEIDGDSHDSQKKYDCARDNMLYKKKHVRTLRISNIITKNKAQCFAILRAAIKDRPAGPAPTKPVKIVINRDKELAMQTEWMKDNPIKVLQTYAR